MDLNELLQVEIKMYNHPQTMHYVGLNNAQEKCYIVNSPILTY